MPVDFGKDISTFPDLDRAMRLRSGRVVLAEALARRLETPRGGLFYDADYGLDVRAMLNDAMTENGLAAIEDAILSEILKDDRVENAEVAATFSMEEESLSVRIEVLAGEEPFPLVLKIDDVSAKILTVGEER